MKIPPNIKNVRIVDTLIAEIEWSMGKTLRIDWGHGLDWPNGLSLGADRLYELCREQAGLPTASEFDRWMQRNSLTLSSAADTLGMTRRMIAHYRTGSRPIPKVVGLACRAIELEHIDH
jgi:hypothetical protein